MDRTELDSAVVERCAQCRGVWIDFFDGEFAGIARELDPGGPMGESSKSKVGCVDCKVEMPRVSYLREGPKLHRCPDCLGTFATPKQLASLAAYFETETDEPPSWWDRFWEWAHRL